MPKVQSPNKEDRECFYCHRSGHIIANCLLLKRKEQQQSQSEPQPQGVGLIKIMSSTSTEDVSVKIGDDVYKLFIFDGLVSLTRESADQRLVRILRDTGASRSFILSSVLPFSEQSVCGYGTVLRNVKMGHAPRPVHGVHIQ